VLKVTDITGPNPDYEEADEEFSIRAQQELGNECKFEYDRAKSRLMRRILSFYPKGTWLCRLELAPQRVHFGRKGRDLKAPTNFYFLFYPSHPDLPVLPLGNDTAWVQRANRHYGLNLKGGTAASDDVLLSEADDKAMMRRVIEYLHFYYSFTHYAGYNGGPMRLRVPRRLDDLKLSPSTEPERWKIEGALWRFLDQVEHTAIRPALKTVTRFINRYQADVPIQVGSALWRLRVSVRLKSGHVHLYNRVPFFHSPDLEPPSPDRVEMLPTPRGIYRWEPWLHLPERFRAAMAAFGYFALATSWLAATAITVLYALTFLLHPALFGSATVPAAPWVPFGWNGLWWSASWSIVLFGLVTAFVFQFDGVLRRTERTAPGVLQSAYAALDRVQRAAWDWFKPNLETPWRRVSTAAFWLLLSTLFLIAAFTTLQVSQEPFRFSGSAGGLGVMQTFAGHATIAFPGLPYLLGALGFDPLLWLKDPSMTSTIVLCFRVMMLIVVRRAFTKLLGYTSPRILYRDNRRLEFEVARKSRGAASQA
jgi:hypothetical protein